MLIEQIIEFESRVPGLLVVHIFQKLVISMTKQKSTKQKSSNALFHAKNVAESKYLNFLDLGQVTKLNPKMQDFKRVLDFT